MFGLICPEQGRNLLRVSVFPYMDGGAYEVTLEDPEYFIGYPIFLVDSKLKAEAAATHDCQGYGSSLESPGHGEYKGKLLEVVEVEIKII